MLLASFIVGHYAVMWFHIKRNWTFQNGPKNVHKSVVLLCNLHPDLANVVKPVIQRNSYWTHPEALLLAMLTDESLPSRERALSAVLQCRLREDTPEQVRPFHLPAVRWEPADYTQIIDLEREPISEPPITLTMSDDGIKDIVHTSLSVPDKPVHRQADGRAVQLVSEAAEKMIGVEARDGYVNATLRYRRDFPSPFRYDSY